MTTNQPVDDFIIIGIDFGTTWVLPTLLSQVFHPRAGLGSSNWYR